MNISREKKLHCFSALADHFFIINLEISKRTFLNCQKFDLNARNKTCISLNEKISFPGLKLWVSKKKSPCILWDSKYSRKCMKNEFFLETTKFRRNSNFFFHKADVFWEFWDNQKKSKQEKIYWDIAMNSKNFLPKKKFRWKKHSSLTRRHKLSCLEF